MTSRYNLGTPGTPLLHEDVLEVPANSKVKVRVRDGGYVYLGVCLKDPSKSTRPDTLVLHNVVGTNPNDNNGTRFTFEIREFKSQDIAKCEILGPMDTHLTQKKDERPERLMVTQIVSKIADVKSIIESIHKMNIKTIVISGLMEGTSGRFGTLGWLCLVVRGLLVCVDIVALKDNKDFWKLVKDEIFHNDQLTKVCHNGRRLIDYLFNQHAITIRNLYDTQVGEMYIRCHQNRDKMPLRVEDITEGSSYNWEYYPVSKIYKTFVPELVLPEEIAYLVEHEGKQFKEKSPFVQRPIPAGCPHYKSSALEVKYLEEVFDAQMKILLSHVTLVMREQIKLMCRANNTVTMERFYIPHNVMEMMKQGSPFLSSDRSEDFSY